MSSIEERLARDIAAVTGGVVMTESDLQEAREVLDLRIDGRRRRNRRLVAAAAAAVVVVAGGVTALALDHGDGKAAGPAGGDGRLSLRDPDQKWLTGEAVTLDGLTGVWRVDNGAVALRFMSNGLFSYDDTGSLFSEFAGQDAYGAYTVDHGLITLITSTSTKPDCVNAQVRLHASTPEPGKVRVVLDYDDTSGCSPVGYGQQALEQVLPAMPGFASSAAEAASEKGWPRLTDPRTLSGLYFDSENHLLELDQDAASQKPGARGRYFVVAPPDDVLDEGTWEAGPGVLTLTSSVESPDCGAGDELVLDDLLLDPVSSGFRGTVTKNTCGGGWAGTVWIHVPDSLVH